MHTSFRSKAALAGRRRNLAFSAALIASAILAPIGQPTTSHAAQSVTHHVLVLPMEMNTNCENPGGPYCQPADTAGYTAPRNSPAKWSALINGALTPFWSTASYGQVTMLFTVLADPFTVDGWWPTNPRTVQDYRKNCVVRNGKGKNDCNWIADPGLYAYVPDGVDVVTSTIFGLFPYAQSAWKQFFAQFDRMIYLSNWHKGDAGQARTDRPMHYQTLLGDFDWWSMVIPEGSSGGWSWDPNGSPDDKTLADIAHESGHSLGMPGHYGDCGTGVYRGPSPTSAECLGPWDVMGYHWYFSQPTAFDRWDDRWLDPSADIRTYFVPDAPFTAKVSIRPLEADPNGTDPTVVRFNEVPLWEVLFARMLGGPDVDAFRGYAAECRERFNGDDGRALATPVGQPPRDGIPVDGLVIEDVHPHVPNVNAMHMVRAGGFLVDYNKNLHDDLDNPGPRRGLDPDHVALQPGEQWTDPTLGLTIQFDGFGGFNLDKDGIYGGRDCEMTIYYNTAPPYPGEMFVNGIDPIRDSLPNPAAPLTLSPDIGLDRNVGPGIYVAPPWGGHDNRVALRVHNPGTKTLDPAIAEVSVAQPPTFDGCAAQPGPVSGPWQRISFGRVEPQGDGLAMFDAPNLGNGGVSIRVRGSQTYDPLGTRAESSFAFQYHDPASLDRGMDTSFAVSNGASCLGPAAYFLDAEAPPGWKVSLPMESEPVAPGSSMIESVHVTPPAGAKPGDGAAIVVHVRDIAEHAMANFSREWHEPWPVGEEHMETVGTMTIIARVAMPDQRVSLDCPSSVRIGESFKVSGRGPVGTMNIEDRFVGANGTLHIADTDGAGNFSYTFTPTMGGNLRIQARALGDGKIRPAESPACAVTVTRISPTITTQSDPSGTDPSTGLPWPAGTPAKDTATVSGGGPTPTGTVTFFMCGPTTAPLPCSSGGMQVGGPVTLSGGKATSAPFTPQPSDSGWFCSRAEYSGDSYYLPASHTDNTNECYDVGGLTPTITTQSDPSGRQPSGAPWPPGTAANDTATVSGTGPTPTGTVTFFICGPTSAPADCASGGQQVGGPVTLTATGTATSAPFTPLPTQSGSFCWRAEYSGDSNYVPGSHTDSRAECYDVGAG